ncbi:hypothetical protein KUF83_05575, partial [Streptomyces sp. BV286]|nr:hypothetical protein [Streptomyces sp. BV286]
MTNRPLPGPVPPHDGEQAPGEPGPTTPGGLREAGPAPASAQGSSEAATATATATATAVAVRRAGRRTPAKG